MLKLGQTFKFDFKLLGNLIYHLFLTSCKSFERNGKAEESIKKTKIQQIKFIDSVFMGFVVSRSLAIGGELENERKTEEI